MNKLEEGIKYIVSSIDSSSLLDTCLKIDDWTIQRNGVLLILNSKLIRPLRLGYLYHNDYGIAFHLDGVLSPETLESNYSFADKRIIRLGLRWFIYLYDEIILNKFYTFEHDVLDKIVICNINCESKNYFLIPSQESTTLFLIKIVSKNEVKGFFIENEPMYRSNDPYKIVNLNPSKDLDYKLPENSEDLLILYETGGLSDWHRDYYSKKLFDLLTVV
jgi:hypothetical protein